MTGPGRTIAFAAALLQITNHAVFKSLLFLGAGALDRATGSMDLDHLGGLLRRMPWTGGAFLVGGMAIAGLPPLNGFASEWLVLQSLVHVVIREPLGIALAGALALAGLAATAALALLCFAQMLGLTLLGVPRTQRCAQACDPPVGMRAAMAALALMCVALGLAPGLLLPTLAGLAPGAGAPVAALGAGLHVPGTGSYPTLGLALAIAALTGVLASARGKRRAAPSAELGVRATLRPGAALELGGLHQAASAGSGVDPAAAAHDRGDPRRRHGPERELRGGGPLAPRPRAV